jgi:CheY-like chemotaxis protein
MLQLSNDYGLRGIALSGYGMAEDLSKTEQAGFLAHLVKPINFEQLHRVLQQFASLLSHNDRFQIAIATCGATKSALTTS